MIHWRSHQLIAKARKKLFLRFFSFLFFTIIYLCWTWKTIQVKHCEVQRFASHICGSYVSSPLHSRKTTLLQLLFVWKMQPPQTFQALPAYFGIFCWLPPKWLQWGNLWVEALWIPSQAFGGLQGHWLQSHMHSSTADICFALCRVLNLSILRVCVRKKKQAFQMLGDRRS